MRKIHSRHIRYITCTLLALMLILPSTSQGSTFKPAPNRLVKVAKQKHPPKPHTIYKRAWAICQVFPKKECRHALNVAYCESGLRPHAKNRYGRRGLYQFGPWEINRFGYGRNTWRQAHGAHQYWKVARWQPWGKWGCKPWRNWPRKR